MDGHGADLARHPGAALKFFQVGDRHGTECRPGAGFPSCHDATRLGPVAGYSDSESTEAQEVPGLTGRAAWGLRDSEPASARRASG